VLPFAFVLVTADLLAAEAIPQLEEFNDVLGSLLEHYQAVDVPCVESHAILPIHDEFGEELARNKYDFIVIMERVQSALYDRREILRIQPVKEEVEGLRIVAASHDAP